MSESTQGRDHEFERLYALLLSAQAGQVLLVEVPPLMKKARSDPFEQVVLCRLIDVPNATTRPPHRRSAKGTAVLAKYGEAPYRPATFDAIIMHGVLEQLTYPRGRRARIATCTRLFRSVYDLLRPDGVLIVSASTSGPLDRFVTYLKGESREVRLEGSENPKEWNQRGPLNLLSYERSLRRAAFREIRSYTVIPDYDKPEALISTERKASNAFFERELAGYRASLSTWSYAFRMLLVKLSVTKYLKPCLMLRAKK